MSRISFRSLAHSGMRPSWTPLTAGRRTSPCRSGQYGLFSKPAVSRVYQRSSFVTKALSVGDKLPDCKLTYFNDEGQLEEMSTGDLVASGKVVIFAVPGAFTPTCSVKHLPGFIKNSDALKSMGVDTIACISVNDAFVMDAWGKSIGVDGKVLMLADGSALFTKAIGLELDLADKGLGIRSRRYAMLLEDGVIKVLNVEEGGAFTISSAEDIMAAL